MDGVATAHEMFAERDCSCWQRVLLVVEMMSAGLGGQLQLPCVANQSTSNLVSSIKDLYAPLTPLLKTSCLPGCSLIASSFLC